MSSRLVLDAHGHAVTVTITTPVPGLTVGDALPVLGNALEGGWLGTRTGRLPDARERVRARGGGVRLRDAAAKGETPDETLSREEAVRRARIAQQREPPDLIGRCRHASLNPR